MTPQELKNSILQMAIQGKLVEQRAEEGTAAELLASLPRPKKPLPTISDDDKDFDIPESWAWAYIGELFMHNTGKAQNSSGATNGVIRKFITTSNLYWNRFDFTKVKEMPFTEQELERCTVKKGDLLVCEGGDCGRSAIWDFDEDVCIQNHVHRLRPYIELDIHYFYHLMYLYKFTGKLKGRGVAIQGLSTEAIHKVICPVPPLAEQHRIVAKIESLLPLIDRYEKAWTRLEEFNKRFPGDMQKSLLQMAIQGKLVEQRSEEGTGEELYRQIQQEKARLVRKSRIKKEKPLPEIAEDEVPFEVPETWKWVRLGSIVNMQSGFAFKSDDFKENGPYKLLRGINLGVGCVRWDDTMFLESATEQQKEFLIHIGDVLLGLDRPWISDGIRVAIYNEQGNVLLVQRVLRIRETSAITNEYIAMMLRSERFKNSVESQTTGISVPHISPGQVANFLIPLPPLAEQRRIVARLEELLPLCESLK